MRPRRPRSLVLAAALLLLGLAGCGASQAAPASRAGPPIELTLPPPAPAAPPPQLAEAPPEPEPEPAEAPPFVGTWISEFDGSLLEMTTTTFHLRFPYEGGTRDNYARVLSYDTKRGHVVIKYTRILQDGIEQPVGDDTDYLLYQIEGDVLQKYIGEEEFPAQVDGEPYRRAEDHNDGQ